MATKDVIPQPIATRRRRPISNHPDRNLRHLASHTAPSFGSPLGSARFLPSLYYFSINFIIIVAIIVFYYNLLLYISSFSTYLIAVIIITQLIMKTTPL